MKILVSNIGSTSFKFRLFHLEQELEAATGSAERIGRPGSRLEVRLPGGRSIEVERDFQDHGEVIEAVLDGLVDSSVLNDLRDLDGVAFKAVMGGDLPAVCLVDERVLERMEYFAPVAPAHNPPYLAAMRMFGELLKNIPLVACFDSGFHGTVPERRQWYAIPRDWALRLGVRRYGFHGASHRYISQRMAELMPDAHRIINCHLGGSSSLCAMRNGVSVATSMGLSPQSGLPQGNRVGDFDPFALALLRKETGNDLGTLLQILGMQSGLAALSETSGDMRDIQSAADGGCAAAQLAIDVYVTAVRDYLGAYLAELGGADAIVFTGGIGQNSPRLREAVCQGFQFAGLYLDSEKNTSAGAEARIDAIDSAAAIWVVETNEELIVARQAGDLIRKLETKIERK